MKKKNLNKTLILILDMNCDYRLHSCSVEKRAMMDHLTGGHEWCYDSDIKRLKMLAKHHGWKIETVG